MKAEWIVREGRPDLLLFFNGWGMDRRLVDHLMSTGFAPGGHDLVMLFDYRELALPAGVAEGLAGYRSVDLVAWSLGVWAAMHAGLDGIGRAVALNGTPFPIDAERGIPPGIFRGTLDNWSDATRGRFERRMFAGFESDLRLDAVRSGRSSADQKEELRSIAAAASGTAALPDSPWRFTKAVIGGKDLIFPPENQRSAWQGTEVDEIADMPHFPFFHLAGWPEATA